MISKVNSGSKIDLEEIQESADEEPIVNTNTQQEVVTLVEPDDISLPIRKTSSRVSKPPHFYYGFHIEEDNISDSTLSELDEPANYKEAMASPKRWHNQKVLKMQSILKECASFKRPFMDLNRLPVAGISTSMRKLHSLDILEAKMRNDIPTLKSLKDWLGKCFAMKDLGDATYILDIKIYKDRSKRLIGLSQDTYLDKILKRFKMENSKKGNLPLHHGIKISKDLCPKTNEELDKMSRNPSEGHWTPVNNILKYLRNTKDRFLVYGGEEELRVTGYCDASWKTDKDDSHLQSGLVVLFFSTNNQLRTSSNLRNQATIQDGGVIVQQVQGIQGQSYSSTSYKSNATSSEGNNASGQARVVKCYNRQGKGHMARQCTQPKRPKNTAWYKDIAMSTKAQEAGHILDEEQLAFLADLGILDGQAVQTIIPNNVAFQTEDLDTYDSDCDDASNAKSVLMANISNYGSDVISEVPHSKTYLNDMENQSVHAIKGF
ncbi:hypothetical protein Tco_0800637 [Tanacetum coccineum]|uniref:Reverse transcriptase Ty1/copia-type domain-containing protein n=1 Tax=Tanacetum coccineum TaxID=301880 RepID=A0ABQ4ZTQ9_9ASTR